MSEENHNKNIQSAMFQGKPIAVTHIIPTLTSQQKERRKQEIENQLYEVFSNYTKDCKTSDNR